MKNHLGSLSLALVLVLMFSGLSPILVSPARAGGPWYVTPSGDDTNNDCLTPLTSCATINGALSKSGFVAKDTINVGIGTYTGTGNEVVRVDRDAILLGGWDATFMAQTGMSIIDGQGQRRGILVDGTISVTVDHFTVQNGQELMVPGSSTQGGGGIASNSGKLTISNSNVLNSQSLYPSGWARGGGIYNGGDTLYVVNSTISGNVGDFDGGGIFNGLGTAIIVNSTISGNRVGITGYSGGGGGGGIANYSGTLIVNSSTVVSNTIDGWFSGGGIRSGGTTTIRNSIVAGNSSPNGVDCSGNVVSAGYNILGNDTACNFFASTGDLLNTDPRTGPIQNNGGPTATHGLSANSPAVNGGNPAGCVDNQGNVLNYDQRGFERFGRCDIGSFERQPTMYSAKTVDKWTAFPGDTLTFTVQLANTSPNNITNAHITDTLPTFLTLIVNSLTASGGTYGFNNGNITWTGDVNAGGNVTLSFGAIVDQNAPVGSLITNSALVEGAGETITRTVSSRIASHFASASKTVSSPQALVGQTLIYQLGFKNASVSAATYRITDTLPSGLTYAPGSLTATSGSYGFSNGAVTWTGTVNPNASVTVTFGAKIMQRPVSGQLVNSAVMNSGGEVITRTATTSINTAVYLPYVVSACDGICGRVMSNGVNMANISLQLRFYNGSSWSTLATTTTASNGSYRFAGLPSLAQGQSYYVRYVNSTSPTFVSRWSTPPVSTFVAGTSSYINYFDIADIPLISPATGVSILLPHTFFWNRRPSTPSDDYEFHLLDMTNGNPAWHTVPSLGYVNSYILDSLPAGFTAGQPYAWYVAAHSPDGGFGESFYYRMVTLSNKGMPLPGKSTANHSSIPVVDDGRPMPQLAR